MLRLKEEGGGVIQLRHRQPSLWHSGLSKDIEDRWEPWMKVDQLLENAALVECTMSKESDIRIAGRMDDTTSVPLYWRIKLRSCRRSVRLDCSSSSLNGRRPSGMLVGISPSSDNREQSAGASPIGVTRANDTTEHTRLGDAQQKQNADED